MLNQMVIVGRLVREPELKETENGKRVTNITLAIPRSYKNAEGEYDTDFLDVTLWNGVAENTVEYVKKGDLLGIKGRITSKSIDTDGVSKNEMILVAEKITFLSSKKEYDKEEKIDKEKDI